MRHLKVLTFKRFLNLHEYQSKQLMSKHQISTQRFQVIESPSEAKTAYNQVISATKHSEVVVKAQVHAGGRGKGVFVENGFKGGVKLSKDPKEVEVICQKMLGNHLRTKQTGPNGVPVHKVMIAEALNIKKETYFALLMDRSSPTGIVMVGSPSGGMDIEAVAEKTPELIYKMDIDIYSGPSQDQLKTMAENLGFSSPAQQQECVREMKKLYDLFLKVDATQIEINPLGLTDTGRIVCFDAKMNFDDNAEFRQKEIFQMRDTGEEDPREVEAHQYNLNYIGMDGNIGCMVNGAGLAMATMDIISLNGDSPANFLDLGGSATPEQVKKAFEIITSDSKVKCILVNIFGGIMKCDVVAKGLVEGIKSVGVKVPLVVRLSGTNVNEGKAILKQSGLDIVSADDLDTAAQKAVAAL